MKSSLSLQPGRFLSADTLIPDPGDPVSYDRHAYTRNNPVRYTDPSGHWQQPPIHDQNGQGGSQVTRLNVLTTSVSSYVIQRPTDLGKKTGLGAQYIEMPPGSRDVYTKLCGDLSFAAMFETVTGQEHTTEMFVGMRGGGDRWTDTGDWKNVAQKIGWQSELVFLDWRDPFSQVSEYLAGGSYLMVCGTLDTQSGRMVPSSTQGGIGHWVVIADASKYGVTLYNPFTNTYQYYTWKEFTETDGATLVITPPPEPDPLPTTHTGAQ
jgi:hypothetical protein